MTKYTKQIEQWAKIYSDTFVNESKEVEENDMLNGRKHNAHIDEAETEYDQAVQLIEDWLNGAETYSDDKDFMSDLYRELTTDELEISSKFVSQDRTLQDAAAEIEQWLKDGSDENDIQNVVKTVYSILVGKEFDEAEIDEATASYLVDDKYVKDAKAALEPLKSINARAYELALKYLENQKLQYRSLVFDPKEFAKMRIQSASGSTISDPQNVDMEKLRADQIDKAAQKIKSYAPEQGIKHQQIKSIWVKSLNIDPIQDSRSYAELQIEYIDGSTEDIEFNIGTTGSTTDYVNADRLYKELKRSMPGATDKDIRLSMIRVAFNDYRIKWFYGQNKIAANNWSFDANSEKLSNSQKIKAIKTPWLEKTNPYAIWKSDRGTTTIYRTEAEKVDESIMLFYKDFNEKFSK